MPDLKKINCAGTYTATGWEADTSYVVSGSNVYDDGGSPVTQNVSGVDCPEEVLQDHRWAGSGEDPLEYDVDGLGSYSSVDVTLYWSEIYDPYNSTGARYFDVYVGGVKKETNYDVYDTAGALNTGVSETYTGITPSSGVVNIQVYRKNNAPMLSGIKITGNNAPACSITSPSDSATVSGTVTINATATDDGSVSGVEFFIDGSSIGTDTTPSGSTYSISWDTTGYSNASHTIKATATDDESATTDDTITVTVNNAAAITGNYYCGTVHVYVDWDGNGNFTGTYDDVTNDIVGGLDYDYGFASIDDRVAMVGTCEFALDNSWFNQHGEAWLYSPDNSAGSLYGNLEQFKPVSLQITYDGTTYTKWTGYTGDITADPTGRTVRVRCVDRMDALASNKIGSNLYTNKQAGYLVSAVLGDVFDSISTDLDTGNLTFEYAGDKWEYGKVTGHQALRDIAESERGRFWMANDGTATYWDTHHEFEDTTVAATFDSTMVSMSPRREAKTLVNKWTVEYTPREVGASPIVVATMRDLPTLAPGESYDYEMRFRDPDTGESIAVTSTVPLVNGTDYSPGGLGITLYSSATTAWGTITNNNSTTVAVTLFQIRGYPVYIYDTALATAEDTTSQSTYTFSKPRAETYRLPLGDSAIFAQAMANYRLSETAYPKTYIESITFENLSDAQYTAILDLEVMDLIRITEGSTGFTAQDFRIIHVRGRMEGVTHSVTYRVEMYNNNNYALVGSAIVGTSTVAPL